MTSRSFGRIAGWYMFDFMEKLRLRGKAEEDLYFAEQDRKLIEAMHMQRDNQREEEDSDSGISWENQGDNLQK